MRTRPLRLIPSLAATVLLILVPVSAASALVEPKLPEPVATYVAGALIPRLGDLYGPGAEEGTGTDFSQAKVGAVHRVLSFTADFLGGQKTDTPTELTNTWVAPVSVAEGEIAGLATVWINPASSEPELATFTVGADLPAALAAAPAETLLVRDDQRLAWFATDGTTLTPLVSGSSGITKPITIADYQKAVDAAAPALEEPVNHGLILAAVVLGIVVLVLAVFILLPDRRRRRAAAAASASPSDAEVYGEEDGEPVAEEEPEPVPEPEPARAKAPAPKAKSAPRQPRATPAAEPKAARPKAAEKPKPPVAAAPKPKTAARPAAREE
jgi:multisubunit Na+/H+ antiporter MnhC subunit